MGFLDKLKFWKRAPAPVPDVPPDPEELWVKASDLIDFLASRESDYNARIIVCESQPLKVKLTAMASEDRALLDIVRQRQEK